MCLLTGWGLVMNGSVVKSTVALTGSAFGPQHSRGGSQPPVTPIPEDPVPSSSFLGLRACEAPLRLLKKPLPVLTENFSTEMFAQQTEKLDGSSSVI